MFDTALIESVGSPASPGRKKSLPLAIGLHAAVIAALVGTTVWSSGEPPDVDPPILVAFPAPAPPPPPRGVSDGGVAPSVHPPTARHDTAPPIALPPSPPTTSASASPVSGPDHSDATAAVSEPLGNPEGIDGGTGATASAGAGTGAASGDAPIVIGADVDPPRLIARVEPEYPESMRRSHVEGVVIVEAVITAQGDVDSLRILKSANPVLDRSAMDAIRRWRYRAATLNGRPVAVYLTVTVSFGLRS